MPDQGLIYISMNAFLPSPGPKELLFFLLFKVLSDFRFRIFLGPSFLAVLKKNTSAQVYSPFEKKTQWATKPHIQKM